ncbi:MAG: TSUP family transporter [Acutalibacteraceae bacterium]
MKRILFLILSGIIGSMGLGAGTVLIIYLTIFENMPQIEAQGINLLFSLPCAALSILIYQRKKLIVKDNLSCLILSGIVGALGGYLILDRMKPDILSDIFACALILLSIYQLFGGSKKPVNRNKH